MTNAMTAAVSVSNAGATAYTVISKSGQRGMEFSDARLAALAFFRAQEQDRPFVLRHRDGVTRVIASARSGRKQVERDMTDDTFRIAYESAGVDVPRALK